MSISVAFGDRYYEEYNIELRFVSKLVRDTWRDFDTLMLPQQHLSRVQKNCRFSFENKEELSRVFVEMNLFRFAGWNSLLDDTDIIAVQEVPAIASVAPCVVFSGARVNRFHVAGHRLLAKPFYAD